MNQLVSGGNDLPPRNLRIAPSNKFGDVGGCFTNEFKVAHSSVVTHGVGKECCYLYALCEDQNSLTKADHVTDIKTPLLWRWRFRHIRRRPLCRGEFPGEAPFASPDQQRSQVNL